MQEDNASTYRQPSDWEKATLEKLLYSVFKGAKKGTALGIFFKLLFIAYIQLFTLALWPSASHNEFGTRRTRASSILMARLQPLAAPMQTVSSLPCNRLLRTKDSRRDFTDQ